MKSFSLELGKDAQTHTHTHTHTEPPPPALNNLDHQRERELLVLRAT